MRKIIFLIITIGLLLMALNGCGRIRVSDSDIIEDGPISEIQDKLENEGDKPEMEPSPSGTATKAAEDIKERDALCTFVNDEIVSLTRDDFNTWEINYFDITGDGTDEAIIINTFRETSYENMEIISGDTGEFKRIPSDIPLGKYHTTADYKDDFLAVEISTGGTGEHITYLFLYQYSGTEMIEVLDRLIIAHTASSENADYEETGLMDGALTDFNYRLTKYDNMTNLETVVEEAQYTYIPDKMAFEVELLSYQSELLDNIYGDYGLDSDMTYSLSIGPKQIITYENGAYLDMRDYELVEINESQNFIIIEIINVAYEGELTDESPEETSYLDKIIVAEGDMTYISHFEDESLKNQTEWTKMTYSN